MREYFLRTKRLGFSQWTENDIELAEYLWGNAQVTAFICASGKFLQRDVQMRLDAEIANERAYHVQYWPIFCLDGQDFIGCCGLRPYKIEEGIYEIGFHLHPDYWGKGLGTEAAEATIAYAFEHLQANDLFAGHHPKNAASAKMLAKLGFHHTHDEYYAPTGLNHPSYRYCAK